ncbi:MAG TPA: dienelactone hydrolase family protein [Alphaproteobacteria bacterium]|nr:dienelactone hydrolase family protein [Alphaproteobacteria bacterium]
MGKTLTLTAPDGHKLSAYRADTPDTVNRGKPKGGLVVIQEIFGVNKHMREVCDGFAKDGYASLAPALFDRAEPGVELGYEAADIEAGRALRGKIEWPEVLKDVAAAIKAVSDAGPVGIVGYCWGGSVAWRAATQLGGLAAAVGYYGGQIAPFKDETPKCPVMLHFGETDSSIPLADVQAIKKAQPKVPVFLYPAGHGFSCDQRASFDRESHELARTRTLEFFARNLVSAKR